MNKKIRNGKTLKVGFFQKQNFFNNRKIEKKQIFFQKFEKKKKIRFCFHKIKNSKFKNFVKTILIKSRKKIKLKFFFFFSKTPKKSGIFDLPYGL